MNLKIQTPVEQFLEQDVVKVVAEGPKGYFGILPRHIDYVSTLVPGILSYVTAGGQEIMVAVDEGVLVKKGADIFVSVRNAVKGQGLGSLKKIVTERIEMIDEKERNSRAILAKLEADFVRRFLELE
jgi:F-type H+-transporting ATPase subunit epsilon